ncbi:DUF6624 domain-containing protein [Plantactinospora solaniradicis]|uniref:DUF6624 domain-containing protein n=1 Tax=Plantactinospora solaniradicis TaxID=1723736 RepID=A0ABW1KJE4_9ACTN
MTNPDGLHLTASQLIGNPPAEYPQIAAELLAMADADEQMRTRFLIGTATWDAEIDRVNTARLKNIIAEIGWPTVSKVGVEASSAAWLLAQHAADDLDFMTCCLGMMKEAGPGEVKLSNIALLDDRVRIIQGQPQVYGTQFCEKGAGHEPFPIEDPESVDERRAAVGLDTLEENVARVREMYQGGGR